LTEIKPPEDVEGIYHSDILDEDFELFSIEKPEKDMDELVVRIIGVERDDHRVYGAFLILKVEIQEGMFTNQLFNEDKPNKNLRQFCTDFGFDDTDELINDTVVGKKILIKPETAYNRKSKEYRKFFDPDGNERYFVNYEYIKRVKEKKKKRGRPKGKKAEKTKECPICGDEIAKSEFSSHVEDCEG